MTKIGFYCLLLKMDYKGKKMNKFNSNLSSKATLYNWIQEDQFKECTQWLSQKSRDLNLRFNLCGYTFEWFLLTRTF